MASAFLGMNVRANTGVITDRASNGLWRIALTELDVTRDGPFPGDDRQSELSD